VVITRVLCPVDFSDFSRHALDCAITIARWYHSTVTALHVLPATAPYAGLETSPPIPWTSEELEQMRLQVTRFVEQDGERGVEAMVVEGGPAREILREAERMPADLLVMGTHGRSGFERFLLGSVTENVLRHASCPVLTVPPKSADPVAAGSTSFRRILCAVDFSPSSMKALEFAFSLAQEADARLTLVHVVEPLPEFVPSTVRGLEPSEYEHAALRKARGDLHEWVPGGVRVHAAIKEIVVPGKSHQGILSTAQKEQSEVIVIGVRGRGPVDRLFFGSTANQIVRRSTCPVFTIRG